METVKKGNPGAIRRVVKDMRNVVLEAAAITVGERTVVDGITMTETGIVEGIVTNVARTEVSAETIGTKVGVAIVVTAHIAAEIGIAVIIRIVVIIHIVVTTRTVATTPIVEVSRVAEEIRTVGATRALERIHIGVIHIVVIHIAAMIHIAVGTHDIVVTRTAEVIHAVVGIPTAEAIRVAVGTLTVEAIRVAMGRTAGMIPAAVMILTAAGMIEVTGETTEKGRSPKRATERIISWQTLTWTL